MSVRTLKRNIDLSFSRNSTANSIVHRSQNSSSSTLNPKLTPFSERERAQQREVHLPKPKTNNLDPIFTARVEAMRSKLEKNLRVGPDYFGDKIMLNAETQLVRNNLKQGNQNDIKACQELANCLEQLENRKLEKTPTETANMIANGILAAWRLDKEIAQDILYDLEMETKFNNCRIGVYPIINL